MLGSKLEKWPQVVVVFEMGVEALAQDLLSTSPYYYASFWDGSLNK